MVSERRAAGPVKILHVTAPAPTGGVETVVHALATGHRDRGHDVQVAAALHARRTDHPFLSALDDAGIPVHEIEVPPRAYLRERRELGELCRRIAPDVVHTHGLRADVVASVAVAPLPLVTTVHGYVPHGPRGKVVEWIQRRALRRFQAVVAVSRPLVDRLTDGGIPRGRVHLVRNACSVVSALPRGEARSKLAVADGSFHVGWVGRLGHEKGPDVLLEAVAGLRDLPIVVSVVGDGDMRPALEERARSLGIADRVRWLGTVPSAARLFRAFDVVALSSRTEGTPIVLLEAMSVGVPVVATSVGGVPDVVSDDEAVLVPSEDPDALAEALRQVHDEAPEELAARVDRAGAAARERFGPEQWLDRYEALYASACASSPSRPRRSEWKPSPSS